MRKIYMLKVVCIKEQPYFFIGVMWKKQYHEACFNLKLVLLLTPISLAVCYTPTP